LKLAKPEPAIYRHAAQGMGFDPASILFIDDRADNVQGGLEAGMQVIYYTTQPAFEEEMEQRGLGELFRTGRLAR
jgi:putative hydrolase of the HAD superfamily